jgi:mono/diheme cytochrome c family protein
MRNLILAGLIISALLGLLSCTEKPTSFDPSPIGSDTLVSFAADVQPILNTRCLTCHGNPGMNNYSVRNYQTVFGPRPQAQNMRMLEVRAGKPDSSYLVWKLEGRPTWPISGERMPRFGPYLDPSEIATIRTWIRQGALDN